MKASLWRACRAPLVLPLAALFGCASQVGLATLTTAPSTSPHEAGFMVAEAPFAPPPTAPATTPEPRVLEASAWSPPRFRMAQSQLPAALLSPMPAASTDCPKLSYGEVPWALWPYELLPLVPSASLDLGAAQGCEVAFD